MYTAVGETTYQPVQSLRLNDNGLTTKEHSQQMCTNNMQQYFPPDHPRLEDLEA